MHKGDAVVVAMVMRQVDENAKTKVGSFFMG